MKGKKSQFIQYGKQTVHRNALGSKKRYDLDKLLRELNYSELEHLLDYYNDKAICSKVSKQRLEARCICGMIRDYMDELFDEHPDILRPWESDMDSEPYFDGEIIHEGEKTYTAEYDENEENIVIRDKDGNIVDTYNQQK